jgi:hypothetical protein
VDEEIARELNEDDLRHKNFTLADIKRIIKLISTLQPSTEFQPEQVLQHFVELDQPIEFSRQIQLPPNIELPYTVQSFQTNSCGQSKACDYQPVLASASKKYTPFDKVNFINIATNSKDEMKKNLVICCRKLTLLNCWHQETIRWHKHCCKHFLKVQRRSNPIL